MQQKEKRLWDTLRYYFGGRYDSNPQIVPIVGELGSLDKLEAKLLLEAHCVYVPHLIRFSSAMAEKLCGSHRRQILGNKRLYETAARGRHPCGCDSFDLVTHINYNGGKTDSGSHF